MRENDIDVQAYKFRSQGREPIIVVLGPAVFDGDMFALDIAAPPESLAEGGHEGAMGLR